MIKKMLSTTITGPFLPIIYFGGICVFIYLLIEIFISGHPDLYKNITEFKLGKLDVEFYNGMKEFGLGSILTGILFNWFNTTKNKYWEETALPNIRESISELNSNISSVDEKINKSLKDIQTKNFPAIIEGVSTDELTKLKDDLFKKLHGNQILNVDGYFSKSQEKSLSYCKSLSKKEHSRHIEIKNLINNDEYYRWEESGSYRLEPPVIKTNTSSLTHEIIWESTFDIEPNSITEDNLSEIVSLVINVDGKDVFNLEDKCRYNLEKNKFESDIGYITSKKIEDAITNRHSIKVLFPISISSNQESEIRIKEKSLLAKDDCNYFLSSEVPYYKGNIVFTLPDDLKITTYSYCETCDWRIEIKDGRTLIANTYDWIHPGLYFAILWERS